MNYSYKINLAILFIAALITFGCQGTQPKKQGTQKATLPEKVSVQEFRGRIYLGGSELSEFIGLQVDSVRAYYLLGVDSLRRYQDAFAIIKGWRVHPQSDSIVVTQVKITHR